MAAIIIDPTKLYPAFTKMTTNSFGIHKKDRISDKKLTIQYNKTQPFTDVEKLYSAFIYIITFVLHI